MFIHSVCPISTKDWVALYKQARSYGAPLAYCYNHAASYYFHFNQKSILHLFSKATQGQIEASEGQTAKGMGHQSKVQTLKDC